MKILKYNRSSLFTKLSLILFLIMIADIILLNMASMIIDKKFMLCVDLSRNKIMTLSSETRRFLADLKDDIVIYGIYEKKDEDKVMYELLKKYGEINDRIKVKFINPFTEPSVVVAFDPQNRGIKTGSVIISDKERRKYILLTYHDLYIVSQQHGVVGIKAEQSITSAIRYIVSGRRPRMVFMGGHDEVLPSQMTSFIYELSSLNYDVRSLNLQESKADLSPSDDVLLFVGPRKDLTEEEFDILSAFLSSGGKVVFLIDNAGVNSKTGNITIYEEKISNFTKLLRLYGLKLNRDMVFGENITSIGEDPARLIVNIKPHSITKKMLNAPGKRPILAGTSSISIEPVSSGNIKTIPLLVTDKCYTKLLNGNSFTIKKRQEDGERGSFITGILSEGSGKILLIGTSFIAAQEGYSQEGNRLFLLSALAYLSDTEMLDIKPKMLIDGVLNFGSAANTALVIILVTIVMPLFVITAGIFVIKKRSRVLFGKQGRSGRDSKCRTS